ncbi:MAG: hypothetical protein AB1413_05450 [Thermodesulfobacteriota bacterium]
MSDFERKWDLAMAMAVLQSPDVDGATWAEAVKWLLFYGPPELRELIGQASHFATSEQFPDLKPVGYDEDGAPCYDARQLADTAGVSAGELARRMAEWEAEAGQPAAITPATVHRVH